MTATWTRLRCLSRLPRVAGLTGAVQGDSISMVRLAEGIVWPWVSQTRAALMASSSVSYGPFILTYSPYSDTQILRCTSVHQRRSQASEQAGTAKIRPRETGEGEARDVRSLTWEVMGALGGGARGTRPPTPCLQSMAKISSTVHGLAWSALSQSP